MFNFLAAHPDICMSTPKETHYFERFERFDADLFWSRHYGAWDGERLIGEATPSNLYVPYVAGRIRDVAPDAKLIAILRDPVRRAFSHWWMRFAEGLEKLSFEDAIEANLRQLETGLLHERPDAEAVWREHMAARDRGSMFWRPYLDAGYYAVQIRRYQDLFGPDRLLVLLTESLRSDPDATMQRVWDFLGVTAPEGVTYTDSRNEAVSLRGQAVLRLVRGKSFLKVIPSPLKDSVRSWISQGEKPTLRRETEAWLADYYRGFNEELAQVLGLTPAWL